MPVRRIILGVIYAGLLIAVAAAYFSPNPRELPATLFAIAFFGMPVTVFLLWRMWCRGDKQLRPDIAPLVWTPILAGIAVIVIAAMSTSSGPRPNRAQADARMQANIDQVSPAEQPAPEGQAFQVAGSIRADLGTPLAVIMAQMPGDGVIPTRSQSGLDRTFLYTYDDGSELEFVFRPVEEGSGRGLVLYMVDIRE